MIIANVIGQTINLTYSGVISDSVRFLTVRFVFDSTWNGTLKTAVFKHNNSEYDVVMQNGNSMYLGDNVCYVPQEVIKSSGFLISVYGVKNSSIITSSAEAVAVEASGYNDTIPADPTPSLWLQIMEISNNTLNIAQSVRDDAEAGVFNGEGVPSGGAIGQVLKKNSYEDYDTVWAFIPEYCTKEEANLTYVPKTLKVNGKELKRNINITCSDIGAYEIDEYGIPKRDLNPLVRASLEKADSAIQVETDPTVPSWAKQLQKPTYKTSELQNDLGFLVANDIATKQDIPSSLAPTETSVLLQDNAIYNFNNVSDLTFSFPRTPFICYINLTTSQVGNINISFPPTGYIGNVPQFGNGETWEISIKNGIIVAGKAAMI